MGIIRLKSNIQKLMSEPRMVTRNVRYSTIGSDLIIARCAQVANVKPATVRSGILGLKEAVRYFVVNGHHVNLGKLGILRLKINAKSVAQEDQISADLISRITIGYQPSVEVKEILSNISLES